MVMAVFLFGLSGGEIVVVLFVVLLLFGADKIPGIARTIGKGMNEFKKATDEIKREIQSSASDIKEDILEARDSLNNETEEIKNDFKNTLDPDLNELNINGEDYQEGQPQINTTKKRGGKNSSKNIDADQIKNSNEGKSKDE